MKKIIVLMGIVGGWNGYSMNNYSAIGRPQKGVFDGDSMHNRSLIGRQTRNGDNSVCVIQKQKLPSNQSETDLLKLFSLPKREKSETDLKYLNRAINKAKELKLSQNVASRRKGPSNNLNQALYMSYLKNLRDCYNKFALDDSKNMNSVREELRKLGIIS